MKVLVLGAGPSGLAAVHAAALLGHDVVCFSKGGAGRKSRMNGAQYLHQMLPLASVTPSFKIDYRLTGDVDGYRDKVGYASTTTVSPESLVGLKEAWNIREAYDWMWRTYGEYIQDAEFGGHVDVQSLINHMSPDVTVSTIPAKILCSKPYHSFAHINIWATDTAIVPDMPDNTVICDGTSDRAWYRCSKIQSYCNTEWPGNRRPPLPQHRLWNVVKPIRTTCDCFPDVHRAGRYGRWEKGELVDMAFYRVAEALARREHEMINGGNYAI